MKKGDASSSSPWTTEVESCPQGGHLLLHRSPSLYDEGWRTGCEAGQELSVGFRPTIQSCFLKDGNRITRTKPIPVTPVVNTQTEAQVRGIKPLPSSCVWTTEVESCPTRRSPPAPLILLVMLVMARPMEEKHFATQELFFVGGLT